MNRRRFIRVVARSTAGTLLPALGLSPGRLRLLDHAQAATAVAPLELAAVAISVIQTFAQRGDGGVAAMLQATLAYQRTSLQLLAETIKQIANLQGQIQDLKNSLPFLLEQHLLRSYYDDATAAASQLRNVLEVYPTQPASVRKRLDEELRHAQQAIVAVRGKLQNHNSLDAAVPYALCMATEVALRYRTNTATLVPPTLRDYIMWGDRILDSRSEGSLTHTVHDEATRYTEFTGQRGLVEGQQYPLDCVALKFKWGSPVVPMEDNLAQNPHHSNLPWNYHVMQKTATVGLRDRLDGEATEWYQTGTGKALGGDPASCIIHEVQRTYGLQKGGQVHWAPSQAAFSGMLEGTNEWRSLGERRRPEVTALLDDANGRLLRISLLSKMSTAIRSARTHAISRLADVG